MAEELTKEAKKEKKPRVAMPEQAPQIRARNFLEVPTGYTPEMAMEEASRCLQCKKPGCVDGCPVGIDIPGFIKLIVEGDFTKSIRHIWTMNSLPAVCGRVCPQEIQCEGKCILAKKGDPVAIGNLERFVADWERENGTGALPPVAEPTGKRVAVVGSGPSGLTVAGDLIATPTRIQLRNLKPGTPYTAQVRLTHRAGQPFNIVETSVVDQNEDQPEIIVKPIDERAYRIIINGTVPEEARYVRGTLSIKTDIDGEEVKKINYYGNIVRN